MSSPDHASSSTEDPVNTATEDPFLSPEFHLRNRSLSSASHVSVTSSTADFCSNAAVSRQRRSTWHWPPSPSRYQVSRLKLFPFRWLAILLCIFASIVIWRLPPPSAQRVTLDLDQQTSAGIASVPRPLSSSGSSKIDPEEWLRENSEDALARKKRWWNRAPSKPKAAIITLVRNEELEGIMQSMQQLEYHWNRKYHYPWIFFNEKPFSEEFKVMDRFAVLTFTDHASRLPRRTSHPRKRSTS
jgi:Glycolipid 2-alpha-mannosyltransferase